MTLSASRRRRVFKKINQKDQEDRGPVTATFGSDGCRFKSTFGDTFLRWQAFGLIVDLRDGRGLVTGPNTIPVPNTALPPYLSPADFRKILEDWRTA